MNYSIYQFWLTQKDTRMWCTYCSAYSCSNSRTRYMCSTGKIPLCCATTGVSANDCFSLAHQDDKLLEKLKVKCLLQKIILRSLDE